MSNEPNEFILFQDFFCDLRRLIYGAIIDDEPLHDIDTGYFSGEGLQGDAQGFRLVVTGYLNYQFAHRSLPINH